MPLDGRTDPFLRWTSTARRRGRVRGAHEVEQVGSFGVVELQRPDDSFEHVFGHAGGVAALEARVVLDADAGEHRRLLATQALHAPVAAVGREAGLFGRDLRSPRSQELADVVPGVHVLHATSGCPRRGRPCQYPSRRGLPRLAALVVPWMQRRVGPERRPRGLRMRAALFNGPKDITVGERPDPVIQEPTDAVVRVVLACVCGSDLWYYRGESRARGRLDRSRVHRRRRRRRIRRHRRRAGRPRRRPVHLQRHVVPALPERIDDLVRRAAALRQRHDRRRVKARRSGCRSPAATLVTVPGSGHSDDTLQVTAHAVGRDGDRPSRCGVRRRQARRHRRSRR